MNRIHALAWMLSSAIAAIAGLLFAVNFKLAPDMWFQGLKSFPAVILGGMDSVAGAALGGLVIGLIESLSQGYIGEGSREIAGFVVIIVVLDGQALRPVRQPRNRAGLKMRTGHFKERPEQWIALS